MKIAIIIYSAQQFKKVEAHWKIILRNLPLNWLKLGNVLRKNGPQMTLSIRKSEALAENRVSYK